MRVTAMPNDREALYEQRLSRYVTAMRNGQPDRVPIPPLRRRSNGQIRRLHLPGGDARLPQGVRSGDPLLPRFRLGRRVPNMVYVWTGLTQAIGLRYYGVPGIDVGADVTLPVPRARRRPGLHEARGVRRADCRSHALPLRDLAAARQRRSCAPRAGPSPTATTSRS